MARDRKRAKQRQQRQQRKAAQSARTRAPLAVEARTTTEPPEPVDEASADAEQAKVVAAAGDPEPELTDGAQQATEPDDEGERDDEGELDDEGQLDASDAAPVDGGEPTRAGGNRFFNFLRACWAELQRVRWPDRRQVGQATGVVLGFVVIAGGYLGLMDAIFSRVVDAIL